MRTATMNCLECQSPMPPSLFFCPACGMPTREEQDSSSGDSPAEPLADHCEDMLDPEPPPFSPTRSPAEPRRGSRQTAGPPPEPAPEWAPRHERPEGRRSHTATFLLALIPFCFGMAGIHRMYTGRVVSGIIQFVTWGFFFWQVVDIINIGTGSYLDADGHRLRDS